MAKFHRRFFDNGMNIAAALAVLLATSLSAVSPARIRHKMQRCPGFRAQASPFMQLAISPIAEISRRPIAAQRRPQD